MRYFGHIYFWVLVAVIGGGLLGAFDPAFAVKLKPLGDGFISLVKMLIAPVIFCTIVTGIAGAGDMKKVGRVGFKSLLYFEVVSTVALMLGLVAVNILQPGASFHVDPHTLDSSAVAEFVTKAREQSIQDFILHLIPKTILDPFTGSGDLLQVLLVAILFGWALNLIGERGRPVVLIIESGSGVLFKMVAMVMKLAPLGAGGAMAFTIGKYGAAALLPLASLMGTFYFTCVLFVFGILGPIAWWAGFSIFRFLYYIREEIMLVLGTSSSESALVPLIVKLERLGCSKSVVGLVVPAGYSFNLDGTNIYLTMAAIFVAQALGVEMTWAQQLTLLAVAVLTSKGASGVTGAGFITLASTLAVFPQVPVAGLALILGVDRFMSEGRALINVIGNGVAAVVISKWEGELDRVTLQRELRTHPDSGRERAVGQG